MAEVIAKTAVPEVSPAVKEDDRDKGIAYQNHVAGYIVKRREGNDLIQVIEMLNTYWKIVDLPVSC